MSEQHRRLRAGPMKWNSAVVAPTTSPQVLGTNCALRFNSTVGLLFSPVPLLIPAVRIAGEKSKHQKERLRLRSVTFESRRSGTLFAKVCANGTAARRARNWPSEQITLVVVTLRQE